MAERPTAEPVRRTAVITGVTHGIGRVTCRELAKSGYNIVALCRNVDAGEQLRIEIETTTPAAHVRITHCDLASLASVRDCANTLQREMRRFDLLVNNAAIVSTRRKLSLDGFELTFATNHLGPFLLTRLLLQCMSSGSRIINVASRAHFGAELDLRSVTKPSLLYDGRAAYAQSKLANVMFTFALARRLPTAQGTVNCLHPGVVRTHLLPAWLRVIKPLLSPGMFDAERGAQTSLHLATSSDVAARTGAYFDEHHREQRASPIAYDIELQEELWRSSERWTGLESSP
jgi:NAD(P)-dependent dehydrogenase (short-subunit alcohol dehydrogenase family)